MLLAAGAVVTPPVLGLAAAAGNDDLLVVRAGTVDVLVLGDELLDSGLAGPGRTRDALGPQLPGWLAALGAPPRCVNRLPDTLEALSTTIGGSDADVVVTTGGTSVGAFDHVHAALNEVGGRLLVDGVDVKPGHPMLLASLPGDRWLVGLPGNPLAACVALLTLLEPLLGALHGLLRRPPSTVRLGDDAPGRAGDGHRLLPVRRGPTGIAELQPSCGSAMLRGLVGASGLAVVGPNGAAKGDEVVYLELPWRDYQPDSGLARTGANRKADDPPPRRHAGRCSRLRGGRKLTASDYSEVLAPALEAVSASGGKIRVVLVFPEGFGGMEAGALWQDLKVGIRDWNAWERIALVTDIGWMRDGLRMFAWAVPGETRAFDLDERDQAVTWAAEQ